MSKPIFKSVFLEELFHEIPRESPLRVKSFLFFRLIDMCCDGELLQSDVLQMLHPIRNEEDFV